MKLEKLIAPQLQCKFDVIPPVELLCVIFFVNILRNKLRLQIVKARVQHRQLEIRYSEHIRDLRSSLSNACALLHRSAEALGGQTSGMKKDGEAVASPESLKEEILVLLQEVEKMNSDHTYCKRELAETISSSDGPVLDPGGSMTGRICSARCVLTR